jgi:hypothetical protein
MAQIFWNGGNGNWTTSTDWTPNTVPGPADDTSIAAAGSYTVTINTAITVHSINISDPKAALQLAAAGTDTVVAGLSNSGSLLVDDRFSGDGGSNLIIGGTLTNNNFMDVGNTALGAATSVTASGLVNTGTLRLAWRREAADDAKRRDGGGLWHGRASDWRWSERRHGSPIPGRPAATAR